LIDAILFDSDGTLVDSEVPGLDVLHDLIVAQGLDISREESHATFRGVRMAAVARQVAARLGNTGKDFEVNFVTHVRAAMAVRFAQGLDPMPGAAELLARLAVPYCVATNGPRHKVEQTLTLSGLRHWFGEHVYSAYEVEAFKPDPGLFLHAAQALGVPPERCAVVEDSISGIEAGLGARMQVYTLHDPDGLPGMLRSRVTLISSLSDLHRVWPASVFKRTI
jgi:HAD superfamily hydrolase (TIGR01509 family)